ncbi:MAG: DNA double-strand break repair nuclease NurA [Candidatus Aenigmatarchaeota archaeon]
MNYKVLLNFLKNKEIIKKKINEIKNVSKLNLKEKWNYYLPKTKEDKCIAIDGSYNFLKYRSLVFYAINIASVIYENSKIKVDVFPIFDIVEDFIYLEDFLKSEMLKKEIEIAKNYCKEFNIILDGSLIYFLNFIPPNERKNYLNFFEESDKLIFSISKTPIKKTEEIDVGFSNEIFKEKNFGIITFYFKLKKSSLVYKVETFEKNKDRIEEIVSLIKFFDYRGYPYILKKAHKEAKISNKDMERFAKILGIKEETGREVL